MAGDIKLRNLSQKAHVTIVAIFMFVVCQNNFEFGLGFIEIASKSVLSGECEDYNGNFMADLDETKSSIGACDAKICHRKTTGNYFVTLSCHPDTPDLDNGNCWIVQDTGAIFPNCCPTVSCGNGTAPTTVDPNSCYDRHTTRSCEIWSNLTNHCTDFSEYAIQNYTSIYCRHTCGACSSG
ncbi:uncharacterized protein LOC132547135 [Ylistrum balloti]|uniref:uncharacterized protein LOC132547135 n=1 Tax=Ylistrum balloti TaxID=509963 RepID=UPI002905AE2C|nr:uncharacterized protein LOC132547135 [Ylistrum balloti]